MAIDPTVLEIAIKPLVSSKGLFDMEGWWGKRSEYLITGWFNQENSNLRTKQRGLIFVDRADRVPVVTVVRELVDFYGTYVLAQRALRAATERGRPIVSLG